MRFRQYATDRNALGIFPSPINAFQKRNYELILRYKYCYEQEEKRPDKEVSTAENLYCFQKLEQILNLPFTYDGIFPTECFQDQPKVTLSFKTRIYCTHV